ncbi:hypothetical protein UFOVP592_38 [uncultured Caudovirales phage]|uniref:Uncharacterized protein n=1 Tax=uncultured Caudovirales phage TaxID=2100421 RepID=A0A6J5N7W5_9CAUD|nr:hypothetical protein UFOVP592_38 [uncultured Caudovirales phage]
MIENDTIDFYNSRLTVDMSQPSKLTTSQRDQVRHYGSLAEALLKNKDLAMFVHHFKFSLADDLASIRSHQPDDNARRIAISNELAGIDNFVNSLKRAVYLKNRIGNTNEVPNA